MERYKVHLRYSNLITKSLVCLFLLIFLISYSAEGNNQDQAIVHYNQGYDYYKKGEYDKAIKELDSSLKFDSDNENAHYGLGNCYYRKQMYDKAVDSYVKAIDINPEFANAHYGLGTAYSALRKTDEADKEFTVYRELKASLAETAESASSSTKSSSRSSSTPKRKSKSKSSSSSKSSSPSATKRTKTERKVRPSIKASKGRVKSTFKALSPKKNIKKILTIPKIKKPLDYLVSFKGMWANSYIGKILIGIVAYIGVVQIWLLLLTFLGLILWKMKKKAKPKVLESLVDE